MPYLREISMQKNSLLKSKNNSQIMIRWKQHTFLHLITMKYKGKGNVREQIMETSHIASKLKALKLEVFFMTCTCI